MGTEGIRRRGDEGKSVGERNVCLSGFMSVYMACGAVIYSAVLVDGNCMMICHSTSSATHVRIRYKVQSLTLWNLIWNL